MGRGEVRAEGAHVGVGGVCGCGRGTALSSHNISHRCASVCRPWKEAGGGRGGNGGGVIRVHADVQALLRA